MASHKRDSQLVEPAQCFQQLSLPKFLWERNSSSSEYESEWRRK